MAMTAAANAGAQLRQYSGCLQAKERQGRVSPIGGGLTHGGLGYSPSIRSKSGGSTSRGVLLLKISSSSSSSSAGSTFSSSSTKSFLDKSGSRRFPTGPSST